MSPGFPRYRNAQFFDEVEAIRLGQCCFSRTARVHKPWPLSRVVVCAAEVLRLQGVQLLIEKQAQLLRCTFSIHGDMINHVKSVRRWSKGDAQRIAIGRSERQIIPVIVTYAQTGGMWLINKGLRQHRHLRDTRFEIGGLTDTRIA